MAGYEPIVYTQQRKPAYMTKYICPAKLDKKVESIIKENTKLLFNEFDCKVYARVDYIIGKMIRRTF